jgi:hypothetical protein
MKDIIKDYLWIDKITDVDNDKIYDTCVKVGLQLEKWLPATPDLKGYGSFSSRNFERYNLFTFLCPELHNLYSRLAVSIATQLDPDTTYYIQSWVNLFENRSYIDWHGHWPSKYKAYHGFYCVNSKGLTESYTDYEIPGQSDTIRIMSEDGLVVLGKSDGDKHRSSNWDNFEKYRVTIAFDLVPVESIIANINDNEPQSIDFTTRFNHYIPFIMR